MPPSHEYPFSQPPVEETPTPETKTSWVYRHPYLATSIAAFAVLVLFLSIFASRSGVSTSSGNTNWIGASIFLGLRGNEAERLGTGGLRGQQPETTDVGYIPITVPSGDPESESSLGNELAWLLAQLIQPKGQSGTTTIDVSSSFSFIPQGLISTANTGKQLSGREAALHAYGNEVGTYIQGFEAAHTRSAQILTDHAEDRGNAEKAGRVDQLGYDMAELGFDLTQMDTVPEEARAAHTAFASAYRVVGTNLTKIAATKTDEEFLNAITAYNESVEALSRRFFILATVFSAQNVAFSSSDPGSVFTFNATPSF